MRLTLRTLLAYLDDTLEPAAAKEIGQKLADAPNAQELVSRIREVTRRRRLTAPPVVGDEVDSNYLAEYLDNLLSPEAVAEIEQVCLESDIHLAEAAACHQILTLIGQPAHVTPVTRQRMYDLVHAIESLPADKRPAARPKVVPPPPPTMFSERPLLARVLSIGAAVLGVVLIVVLVLVSLNVRGPDKQVANVDPGSPPPSEEEVFKPTDLPDDQNPPRLPDLPIDDLPPTVAETKTEMPADPASDSRETPAADPSARPDEPVTSTDSAARPESKAEPAKPEPAMPESQPAAQPGRPAEPAKEKAAEPEPAAPPAAPVATYVSNAGVLMRAIPEMNEWRRIAARTGLKPGDRLVTMPSYRADVQFQNGASLEMVGDTELVLLETAEGVTRIEFDRGQLVLGSSQGATTFEIQFLDRMWQVVLPAPEVVVGLSLTPAWRAGMPGAHEAVLVLPRGEVELKTESESHRLGGPVQFRWTSANGRGEKQGLTVPPAWMEREPMAPLEVRASESLEESLPLDSSPALPLIEALASDRRELRLLAVRGLGATSQLPTLIDALNTLDKREVRQESIRVLRQFMARSAEHEEVLKKALLARFQDSDRADGVMALLRGFSEEEAKQREVYSSLIDLLSRSHELGVRELAITNLEELAGRLSNVSYSPDKPTDAAIAAWRRALEDNRLPPRDR